MIIKEAQQQVDQWVISTGVWYFNELTNTDILMEEVGEVARIMSRKYWEQSFKNTDAKYDPGEEIAIVLFVLICLANQTGIDLTEAFQAGMTKCSDRDAKRHHNNPTLSD